MIEKLELKSYGYKENGEKQSTDLVIEKINELIDKVNELSKVN